jgi:hypothetical protein
VPGLGRSNQGATGQTFWLGLSLLIKEYNDRQEGECIKTTLALLVNFGVWSELLRYIGIAADGLTNIEQLTASFL